MLRAERPGDTVKITCQAPEASVIQEDIMPAWRRETHQAQAEA